MATPSRLRPNAPPTSSNQDAHVRSLASTTMNLRRQRILLPPASPLFHPDNTLFSIVRRNSPLETPNSGRCFRATFPELE